MSHIFISYSHENRDYARHLASKLREMDLEVWIDERIQTSSDWWEKIHEAISTCAAFIVIMTPESERSKWVQREVTLADSLNKISFPILLSGNSDITTSPAWSIYVRTQYVAIDNGDLPKPSFYEVLKSVVAQKKSKIRFDGYYECFTSSSHNTIMTIYSTYAIVFHGDGRFTEYSEINAGMNTAESDIFDDKHPEQGIYFLDGDLITLKITHPSVAHMTDATYHGYMEEGALKLEINIPRARPQMPWHQIERRLYLFKPFNKLQRVAEEQNIQPD